MARDHPSTSVTDTRARAGLVAMESAEYRRLLSDPSLAQTHAMRSKHA